MYTYYSNKHKLLKDIKYKNLGLFLMEKISKECAYT